MVEAALARVAEAFVEPSQAHEGGPPHDVRPHVDDGRILRREARRPPVARRLAPVESVASPRVRTVAGALWDQREGPPPNDREAGVEAEHLLH
eukprot:4638746-Prymnesium_polylepis.1